MTTLLNQDLIVFLFPVSFLLIFLICMTLVTYVRQQRKHRALVEKIQHGGFVDAGGMVGGGFEKGQAAGEKGNPLVSFFRFFSGKNRESELSDPEALKLKFLIAGVKARNFESAFFGAKLFLPFFLVLVFLVLKFFVFKVVGTPMTVALIVALALTGFYLPDIWLKQKTDKRKKALFRALPDALDLLVVCVEAGMGLDAALHKVGEEIRYTYPDLSREFSYLNLEMRAGKPRQEALKNLSRRTGIDEMNSLVTLLIQTDKFGTSVASALKVFADSFRTKRFQMAEEIAAKLPVKILIPLILFIFPSLFVVILGPAAITIYKNIIMG